MNMYDNIGLRSLLWEFRDTVSKCKILKEGGGFNAQGFKR